MMFPSLMKNIMTEVFFSPSYRPMTSLSLACPLSIIWLAVSLPIISIWSLTLAAFSNSMFLECSDIFDLNSLISSFSLPFRNITVSSISTLYSASVVSPTQGPVHLFIWYCRQGLLLCFSSLSLQVLKGNMASITFSTPFIPPIVA